jgi:23S rRNA (cytidine1920-2'-O)/16S rRNA (cytidine1409-2'-O)-methyltransferase
VTAITLALEPGNRGRPRRDPAEYAAAVARPRTRLDSLLVERGLYESRSRAAAAVIAGDVRVGRGLDSTGKPGRLVDPDTALEVVEPPRFVSRGGVKLANALDALDLRPAGRLCLDVGASTGGFTDCLLQREAEEVTVVDVAYGELHWRLRNDPRVTVLERTNARRLDPAVLPYRPDMIVMDVSFISLAKVLPAVLGCAADDFDALALVKPQFEVGRDRVGRGGVVREAEDRRAALVGSAETARQLGRSVLGFASSGLPGPAGNRETFLWIGPAGDARAIGDVEAAARKVEP